MKFEVLDKDPSTRARRGRLQLSHGVVDTPVFMPVGTQATVKAMTPDQLRHLQVEILLCNSYHLFLRPGHDLIARLGGLHLFMAWDRPILTDSGGYQVFSLADLRDISDEGVKFQSHLDGSAHYLTPESAIDIQRALGRTS
jgi:queuine tRNA-ribosyltransferase